MTPSEREYVEKIRDVAVDLRDRQVLPWAAASAGIREIVKLADDCLTHQATIDAKLEAFIQSGGK